MSTTIKRSQFMTFLNTAPSGTATYKLIGDGVTSAEISYNPKTTEEAYIHQDTGTTVIDGYAPTMPIEAVAKNGDDVYEFVDELRKKRAILDAAVTDVVNVWLYETPTSGEYPAEKQAVSIQIDSFGGDGGASNKISYTINYQGDAVRGTFNPVTKTFTAT